MNDSARTYTEAEEAHIAQNLLSVTSRVHAGHFSARLIDVDLLCELHDGLFHGVRDFAGRIRRAGFGSEFLTFGPNRSLAGREVPDSLLDLFSEFGQELREIEDTVDRAGHDERALKSALRLHARVIRIHPFEDGNGRSCRLLLNIVLVRLGLKPIAFEVPKDDYRFCLNEYFRSGDLQPLFDLALYCYGP